MTRDIKIVYEDNNLLVVNKPSGLITHPKNSEDKQDSLTGWLVEKYPEIKTVGEAIKVIKQKIQ